MKKSHQTMKAMKGKNKVAPKRFQVVSSTRISEHFQRVVVAGADIEKMPMDCAGQYIKLLFNEDGSSNVTGLDMAKRPTMRTYTIRSIDPQNKQLVIDFVVHDNEHGGVACNWALNAKVDDVLTIAGPGPIQEVPADSNRYLYIADMTSLPAAAVSIERLPSMAKGLALIQVASESDIQTFNAPDGIEVRWLIGSANETLLSSAIENLAEIENQTYIWCACEFGQMRASRRLLTAQTSFDRELSYFSSYWKPGITEDGHKQMKQQDVKACSTALSE